MHAGVSSEQEGDLVGARSSSATANGVVDHVYAVCHRLVNGCRQVRREAA
jgi:hypothetical protein